MSPEEKHTNGSPDGVQRSRPHLNRTAGEDVGPKLEVFRSPEQI